MKNTAIVEQQQNVRAIEVANKLREIKDFSEDSYLTTCELLHEANTGNYHRAFGYTTFSDWVVQGSGLGMSWRNAYYLINIWTKALKLGITKAQLRACCVSKCKEIFSLNPDQFGKEMVELVETAPGMTLDQVKVAVTTLKTAEGEEPALYLTLKLSASIKDTLNEAFELCRRQYGSVETENGVVDISDSKCMELICVSYIQDPNNQG
jgi:hypothetical protein